MAEFEKLSEYVLNFTPGQDDRILAGLRLIVNSHGKEALTDSNCVSQVLARMAPGDEYKKDRNRVCRFVGCGAAKEFLDDINCNVVEDACFIRAVNMLDEELDMRADAAARPVLYYAEVLGIRQMITEQAEKCAPGPEPDPAAAPDTSGSQNFSGYNDDIVIDRIEVFEGDGAVDGNKTYGGRFFDTEARHIGIKVFFCTNHIYDRDVTIVWNIFSQDGASFSGDICSTFSPSRSTGCQVASFQWGWSDAGNWRPGNYKVTASIDNCRPLSASFEIAEGQFDYVPVRVISLDLFESAEEQRNFLQRRFTTKFRQSETRRIYFQLAFQPVDSRILAPVRFVIKKENNEVMTDQTSSIVLERGYDHYWTGYGWDDPGNWEKGKYTYTVYLCGSPGITAKFRIV